MGRNFYRSSDYPNLKTSTQSESVLTQTCGTDKKLETIPEIVDRIDELLSLENESEIQILLRDIMVFLNTCDASSFARKLDYCKSQEAYGRAVAYAKILNKFAEKQDSETEKSFNFNIVGAILKCLNKDFIRDYLTDIKQYAEDKSIVASYFLFDDSGYRMAMWLSDNDFAKALELLAMSALRF